MMKLGVKFCGVTNEADIRKAANAGARSVGVIVQHDSIPHVPAPGSHTVGMRRAYELREAMPAGLEFVLLPRSGGTDIVGDMLVNLVPDRLQIGHVEDPALVAALRDRYDGAVELDQVIHVGDRTRATDIDPFVDEVDYIHIDSEGPLPGGNSYTPDLLKSRAITDHAHEAGRLVIFSGGLNRENVASVIRQVGPDGVDAESANRSEFGVYNQKMMKEFVDAAV